MTSYPSSTTSVTISQRRRCGSSLSRSSHGTSRAAKQSGRKRRRASLPGRINSVQVDLWEEAIKRRPWRQLWDCWEPYNVFTSLQEFGECTASCPVNILQGRVQDVAVGGSVRPQCLDAWLQIIIFFFFLFLNAHKRLFTTDFRRIYCVPILTACSIWH